MTGGEPADRPGARPHPAPDGSPSTAPPALLLGPILRHVAADSATVWVEADRPCTVRILGVEEPTWTIHGHHFALVVLTGLERSAELAYEVHLDGARVWPLPGAAPSVIRTFSAAADLRLAFGSCRRSAGDDRASLERFGADALVALARRMRERPTHEWPDAIFLGGDQVYADEPSPDLRARLRARHREAHGEDPRWRTIEDETHFEEYTWLYADSWGRADVRWLLSTVPSMMLLDDHDLRDDWNTSEQWRRRVTAEPWWRARVLGAFASYWVYQHLGNLSPAELAEDELFAMVRGDLPQAERDRRLDEFAWQADADPDSTRWSYTRDFGGDGFRVRFVAVDARCSRVLDPTGRTLLDPEEHDWLTGAISDHPVDHLLIGVPLPMMMVRGIHHLEGWNEAVAGGRYGGLLGRIGEAVRQKVDLEHWAAFRLSLTRVLGELGELGRGPDAPASVLVLSGDVHCSYVATARLPGVDPARTSVHQLTMSPFRNPLEPPIRWANRLLSWRAVRTLMRGLARHAHAEQVPAHWDIAEGLWFDNGVMTVVLRGRRAEVEVDHAQVGSAGEQVLRRTATVPLAGSRLEAPDGARARGSVSHGPRT